MVRLKVFPLILVWTQALVLASALAGCGNMDFPSGESPLPAPDGVVVDVVDLDVRLTWNPVAGASGYLVWWDEGSTVTPGAADQKTTTETSYLLTGLTSGQTYAYVVQALNRRGSAGLPSSVVTATPSTALPGAPQRVRATAGNRMVTLQWDPVAGALTYRVSVSSALGNQTLKDVALPKALHTSLINQVTYYYSVRAVNGAGVGPASDPAVPATPMPTLPGTPVIIDVTVGLADGADGLANPFVDLSWTAADHASEYHVYARKGITGAEESLTIPGVPLRATRYTHRGPDIGTMYFYSVEAVNEGVLGGRSEEVRATPLSSPLPDAPFPTGLAVEPAGTTSSLCPTALTGSSTNDVLVCWSPVSAANSGYRVSWQWQPAPCGPISIGSAEEPVATTFFLHQRAVPDMAAYSYTVKVDGNTGGTAPGVVLGPSAPRLLNATSMPVSGGAAVDLTWTPSGSTNVVEQRLYRGSAASGPCSLVTSFGGNTSNAYTDTNVSAGTTYYYVLRAFDGVLESADSNQPSATP
jgi:fibronectin type 3 domain-containing protein